MDKKTLKQAKELEKTINELEVAKEKIEKVQAGANGKPESITIDIRGNKGCYGFEIHDADIIKMLTELIRGQIVLEHTTHVQKFESL